MLDLSQIKDLKESDLSRIDAEIKRVRNKRSEESKQALEQKYKGKCYHNEDTGEYFRVLYASSCYMLAVMVYKLPENLDNVAEKGLYFEDFYFNIDEMADTVVEGCIEITPEEYKNTLLSKVKNILDF